MNLFFLKAKDAEVPPALQPTSKGTLKKKTSGEAQMVPVWGGQPLGPPPQLVAAQKELKTATLADEYEKRLKEVFGIIKTKVADDEGWISVEKVKVKLGVDAGGKIGFFVEGHFSVAFAFEVEFKIGKEGKSHA